MTLFGAAVLRKIDTIPADAKHDEYRKELGLPGDEMVLYWEVLYLCAVVVDISSCSLGQLAFPNDQ